MRCYNHPVVNGIVQRLKGLGLRVSVIGEALEASLPDRSVMASGSRVTRIVLSFSLEQAYPGAQKEIQILGLESHVHNMGRKMVEAVLANVPKEVRVVVADTTESGKEHFWPEFSRIYPNLVLC
jgi:hypothetical protein